MIIFRAHGKKRTYVVSEGAAAGDATWELGAVICQSASICQKIMRNSPSDVPVSCCLFLSLSTSSTFPLRVRETAAASQRHMRTTNATLGFIFFSVWSCHFVEKEDKNGGRGDRVARRKGRLLVRVLLSSPHGTDIFTCELLR